jgi:hypothetical protein
MDPHRPMTFAAIIMDEHDSFMSWLCGELVTQASMTSSTPPCRTSATVWHQHRHSGCHVLVLAASSVAQVACILDVASPLHRTDLNHDRRAVVAAAGSEKDFSASAAILVHPKWRLCGADGGGRHYNVGRKSWWSVNLFLRYWKKDDDDAAFGTISLLKMVWLPLILIFSGCKPNPAIGMCNDVILDVMTPVKALTWSSISAMFGSTGIDGCLLIFEEFSHKH